MVAINTNFRLRDLRVMSGLTQAELSRQLGLKSSSTVTMWENGQRHPPCMMLPRLADALHCTVDELFGRGESQNSA